MAGRRLSAARCTALAGNLCQPQHLLLPKLLLLLVGQTRVRLLTALACSICSTYCCRQVTGVTQVLRQCCCQQRRDVLLLLQGRQ